MREIFEREFGRPAEVATSAPGRVNIIGEHTDYNGGFMLPIALPHRTDVLLAVRDDSLVRVRSLDLGDAALLAEYRLDEERQRGDWLDYVQGVTRVARTVRSHVPGCDILISSTVPIGKGLSSSAALQVGLFRALNRAWQLDLDDPPVLDRAAVDDADDPPHRDRPHRVLHERLDHPQERRLLDVTLTELR